MLLLRFFILRARLINGQVYKCNEEPKRGKGKEQEIEGKKKRVKYTKRNTRNTR